MINKIKTYLSVEVNQLIIELIEKSPNLAKVLSQRKNHTATYHLSPIYFMSGECIHKSFQQPSNF